MFYKERTMSSGIWFWIIFVIALLFGAWTEWPFQRRAGTVLVVFILLALLGYRVFGGPVQ
jgi:cell division protein FtsW (lipid II flippase)